MSRVTFHLFAAYLGGLWQLTVIDCPWQGRQRTFGCMSDEGQRFPLAALAQQSYLCRGAMGGVQINVVCISTFVLFSRSGEGLCWGFGEYPTTDR